MIDDALRRFRAYLPDDRAGTDAARSLAHRVMDQALAVPRRTRRRGVAVAAVSGLAAMGALAVVVVKVDRRSGSAAPIVIGTPRADWGMRALVTVTPDPGVSVGDATQRAKELVAEQLERMDTQGAEVSSPKPGQLALKVPGAESPSQFRFATRIPHLRIYESRQIIASGTRLEDLRKGIASHRTGLQRGRVHYLIEFAASTRPRRVPSFIFMVDSPTSARTYSRRPGYSVLPFDAAWTYAFQSPPGKHLILRGASAVPSHELSLSVEGGKPVVRYPTANTTPRTSDLIMVTSGGSLTPEGTAMAYANAPDSVTTSKDGSTRTLRFPARAANTIDPSTGAVTFLDDEIVTSQKSLNGALTFTNFGRYGTRPASVREAVTRPPQLAPTDARWSRTFVAHRGWAQLTIYEWRSSKSKAGTSFIFGDASGGGLAGPLSQTGQDAPWCPFGLGAPPVHPCIDRGLQLTSRSSKRPRPAAATLLSAGRAAPGTSRVEVHLRSGRVITGDIDRNWYAVFTDDALAPADWRSPARLRAYDGAGKLIQEITIRVG